MKPYAIATNSEEGIDVCLDEEEGKFYLMRFPDGATSQYFNSAKEAEQTYHFGNVDWEGGAQ